MTEHERPARRIVSKVVSGVVSTAVVASSLIFIGGSLTAAPAAAADPFLCTPGAVFVQSSSEIREFAVAEQGGDPGNGGTLGTVGIGADHSDNGLGISAGGRYAYTVTNNSSSKVLAKHDRITDQTTRTSFTLNSAVLRGAVNPVTGVYYFASSTANNAINLYAWNESVTPQTYVQVGTLRPTADSSSFGANGDMAFSASGQLVLVADQYIYSADLPDTLQSSTATLDAKQVHDMGDGVQGNGVAFGNRGHLFVSASGGGSRIMEVDLPRGDTVNTTSLGSFAPTDMSSCTFPNTLTLKKDLPEGRQAPTDQFALSIDAPAEYSVSQTSATTTGSAPGVQPDYAGPVFTNQGDSFALAEAAAGSTDLADYDASLVCEQINPDGTTTPVAVTAANELTQPTGALGTDVTCTFSNVLLAPGLELRKSSDPAPGTAVQAAQRITYEVQAENTGNTVLNAVDIADDLSGVLSFADYQDDVSTSIDGTPVTTGMAAVSGDDLTWSGTLQPGQIVSIDYSVIVNDDVEGETIANTVTASGTPPGADPIVPPAVTIANPVAGFTLTKTADPVSGSVVEPGDVIEYTVTGTNTGETTLAPASISDDLAGVLAHAQYRDDLTTMVDGVEQTTGAATLTGSDLAWNGTLQAGQSVTITYSVTVDDEASGEILLNTASGSATPTTPNPADPTGPPLTGDPIVPPAVSTEHPINDPGFEFSKAVEPNSGTAVDPGDVVTYVLTGVNTGETALDSVEIVDDLSGVLADSSIDGDIVATIDGATAAPATIQGDELSWTGALAVGQTVTITYSVLVGPDAAGDVLQNSATATATPPGGEEITPPVRTTSNPVNAPGFSVSKSASPESGTAVDPGTVVTYTVTGVNTGETALDPVSITDDLSGVLAHAELTGDPAAAIDGASASAPVLSGDELAWTGSLQVGQTVTLTYSVTVAADAGGETLANSVTGAATPPGGVPPIETPPAVTQNPINEPGFELVKTADPVSGTTVDPGSVVTYTVTGVNTGETGLEPVTIVDDLSGVLEHAEYNGDVAATIGGAQVVAPTVQGDQLSWQGALAIGERVEITYSVTVDADAGGETIANVAEGAAVAPGGAEITPPPAATEHRVGAPGFAFAKTADVASRAAVAAGSVLTYTLTGTNTGETDLDEVVITDDLGKVLDDATLGGDVVAEVGDRVVGAPVVSGTQLRWVGSLAQGETVTITYAVTVNADAAGATLENVATASAIGPGGEALTAVESATTHPVQTPLAVTGGQLAPWVLGLALALLLGGAVLLILRRRTATV